MGSKIENLEHELAVVKRRSADDILAKNEEIQSLRRELEATIRAKQENDERFQMAAAEALEEARELRSKLNSRVNGR